MPAGDIKIGIGGWVFERWRETFYPPGLAKTKELAYASRQVTSIEINATFYRTQSKTTFARWAAETPEQFAFALKASRYAVNRKDLADGQEAVARFVESGITELGAKLGPILWQLAGTKKFNADEIDGFFSNLPKEQDGLRLRHVIEPRHASFQSAEFVALARRHNVAVCLALADDYPMIADLTADFSYLRLQTTRSEETNGYDEATVKDWSERFRALSEGRSLADLPLFGGPAPVAPRDVFAYVISGAKERNPAAAVALLAALRTQV